MYPTLKKTTQLCRRKNCCWITNFIAGYNSPIPPGDAVILALCSGALHCDDVVRTASRALGIGEAPVQNILARYTQVLEMKSQPDDISVRYDPATFLYRPVPIAQNTLFRLESPVEMLFALTHRCQFRCIYCFNDSGAKARVDEIDTAQWLEIIRQAKAMDVQRVTITGGEPLLHSGLKRIVDALLAADIYPYICTNGYLIDDDFVSWLTARGILEVQISLDTAETAENDRLTQIEGSYARVTAAIARLAAAGISVTLKAVLLPSTLRSVDALIEQAHRMGTRHLMLDRFSLSACGRGDTGLIFPDAEMETVNSAVAAHHRDRPDAKLSIQVTDKRNIWRDTEDVVSCGALKSAMIILPNGDVTMCEQLVGVQEATIGNARTQTLETIWQSPNVERALSPAREAYDQACLQCGVFEHCRAGCYALKHGFGLPFYAMDPRCFHAPLAGEKENG